MSDEELIEGFENCTLANNAFHHEEHIRVAFLYLSRYSVLEALDRFSGAIIKFAAAHGKTERYNETVTWAYIFIIRDRMTRAACSQTWQEFRALNPDLFTDALSVLQRYYRPETLTSPLAKNTFLFPDRL